MAPNEENGAAMAYIIAVLNQKGGVGKSTVARLLAVEFARLDGGSWDVKIADLDVSQGTSHHWMQQRARNKVIPEVRVEAMRVDRAIAEADRFHVLMLDGAPHATNDTEKAAKASMLSIFPSGVSVDDMRPTVSLLHELKHKGVDPRRMLVVLTGLQDSEAEEREAREYFALAGYQVAKTGIVAKTLYRRALDMGQSLSEVKHKGLSDRAQALFTEITNRLTALADLDQTNKEHAA